ncbi:hypothetical protein ACT16_13090 [Mycobacterium heckeshornense]|nr:hypothetical protein ACT16_13090 [Mycobacterium heckeshornense]
MAEAPRGWEDPRKKEALGYEARTTLVENAFLESQVSAATPPQVAGLIHDYVVANWDQEEATMRRMGSQVDAAIDRGNAAIEKLNAVCGLS